MGFLTCCPDKSVNKTPLIRLSMWEQGKLLMLICSFSVSGLWSYNRFSSFWLIWKTCSRSHLVYIYGSCNRMPTQNFRYITQWKISTEKKRCRHSHVVIFIGLRRHVFWNLIILKEFWRFFRTDGSFGFVLFSMVQSKSLRELSSICSIMIIRIKYY